MAKKVNLAQKGWISHKKTQFSGKKLNLAQNVAFVKKAGLGAKVWFAEKTGLGIKTSMQRKASPKRWLRGRFLLG